MGHSKIEYWAEREYGISKAWMYQVMDLNRFFTRQLVADFATKLRPMIRCLKAAPAAASFQLSQFLAKHGLNWRRSDLQKFVNQVFPRSKTARIKKNATLFRSTHENLEMMTVRIDSSDKVIRYVQRKFNHVFIQADPSIKVTEPPPVKSLNVRLIESTPQRLLRVMFPMIRGKVTPRKVRHYFEYVRKPGSG
jgi:hypothetical protein